MTFTSGEILSQSVRCRWAVAARDFSGVSPCRSESGGSAGDVSSLPASWLPRIDRLARSSFFQVALGARHGESPGLQPHGRHSAPTRQLTGPFSCRRTSRRTQFHAIRWRTLSCRRTRVASAHRSLRFFNQPDAISRQLADPIVSVRVALARLISDSDLSDAISRQLNARRWTLSCRRDAVGTHQYVSQVSNETDATARQCASSLVLNHCVYWYPTIRKCSCVTDSLTRHGNLLLVRCLRRTAVPSSREHSSLALTVLRAGKPSGAFAHILTPTMYITALS